MIRRGAIRRGDNRSFQPEPDVPEDERCVRLYCMSEASHLVWWPFDPDAKERVCVLHARKFERAGGVSEAIVG